MDLLAFGAHPDDVELYAGGTLARMSALGYETGIVDLTRGEMGSRGTPAIRAREAKEAAAILKVRVRENLGLPDGGIRADAESRLKVVRILRRYRPLIVLAPYPEQFHPDHANAGRLVAEAAHHAGLSKVRTGRRRFRPAALLSFMLPPNVIPTFIIDVSDYVEQRASAIRAYRSQLSSSSGREPETYLSRPGFLSHIETLHAYYGILVGRNAGEAFHLKDVLEMPDPVDFFRRQGERLFR